MKLFQDFVDFFKGSKPFSTFFFGSLLMVVPFFGASIVNGFQVQAVRNQLNRHTPTLPSFRAFNNWTQFFSNGIFTVLAIYIISAPVLILTAISLIADFLYAYSFVICLTSILGDYGQCQLAGSRSTLWIGAILLFGLNLISVFLLSFIFTMIPAMIRRVADENSFWVAIDFPGHFVLAWKYKWRYIVTWLIVFTLLFFASTIAGTISTPFNVIPFLGLILFWGIYGFIRFGRRLI